MLRGQRVQQMTPDRALPVGFQVSEPVGGLEEAAPREQGGKQSRKRLSLSLSDDGLGIAPATPKGFGLTTMTERVRSLGGTCEIESAPAKGTIIRVEIQSSVPARR